MRFLEHFREADGRYDQRVVFASGFLFGFTSLAFILLIWRMQLPVIVCL